MWIQQFEERVEILRNDPLIMDGGSFEIVRIGKDAKGEDDPALMARFWTTQWGYFVVKSQLIGSSASETTEDILRLISYQNEDGWVVLTVGSAPVLVGRGVLILKLLEEFPKWKQNLRVKAFLMSLETTSMNWLSKVTNVIESFFLDLVDGSL